jgi:hypothetical protein
VIEVDAVANKSFSGTIPALTFSTSTVPDGSRVVSCGFPSHVIVSANIAPDGTYMGGCDLDLRCRDSR